MLKSILRVLALCGVFTAAMAQQFPLWERVLAHYSGKTDETPVSSMKMGNHMQMSLRGRTWFVDSRGVWLDDTCLS